MIALFFLILELCVRHKQISNNKTAFNVEEALSIVLACKLPLFDQSALEGGRYLFNNNFFFLNNQFPKEVRILCSILLNSKNIE